MKEHRITTQEIYDETRRLIGHVPSEVVYAFALSQIMSDKGIRYRHHFLASKKTPELLPPYEAWRDVQTQDIIIRQGKAE